MSRASVLLVALVMTATAAEPFPEPYDSEPASRGVPLPAAAAAVHVQRGSAAPVRPENTGFPWRGACHGPWGQLQAGSLAGIGVGGMGPPILPRRAHRTRHERGLCQSRLHNATVSFALARQSENSSW